MHTLSLARKKTDLLVFKTKLQFFEENIYFFTFYKSINQFVLILKI